MQSQILNVYLFIELLKAADPNSIISKIKQLEMVHCTTRSAVQLAEDKVVAHIDCDTGPDATRALLEQFTKIEGIVQTNIISVVRPTRD